MQPGTASTLGRRGLLLTAVCKEVSAKPWGPGEPGAGFTAGVGTCHGRKHLNFTLKGDGHLLAGRRQGMGEGMLQTGNSRDNPQSSGTQLSM